MASPRVHAGDILPFTAPVGGVTTGVGYWINGLFVVANITVAATVRFAGEIEGVYPFVKATGFTLAEGEACYWDATNERVDAYAAGFSLIGHCANLGGVANTTLACRVRLQQSPTPIAPGAGGLSLIADPLDFVATNYIPSTLDGTCGLTSGAGAETRQIATATEARRISISMDVDGGGDITLTQQGGGVINSAGATSIVFGDAQDTAVLESVRVAGAWTWQVTSDRGVTVA